MQAKQHTQQLSSLKEIITGAIRLLPLALLGLTNIGHTQTTVVYQNDFENPTSFTPPDFWADANYPSNFTAIYPTTGAVIQNYRSPDVIKIGAGIYTDPSGIGKTYAIGMVNPERELMSFSFDASGAGNFVNFGIDITKAGLVKMSTGTTHYYDPSPLARPNLNFQIYDTPNGLFNLNTLVSNANAYPLLNSGTFVGKHSPYHVMEWTHLIGSFDITQATDGNVTLVIEKPAASATANRYTVFDNLSIVVSQNAPGEPTITKAFSPATINVGSTGILTLTITGNQASLLTGLSVTDNLPSPLQLTGNNSTTCLDGTLLGSAGSTTLSLINATLPAKGCTITAEVRWPSSQLCTQPITNTIKDKAFQINSLEGFNPKPASATLTCEETSRPELALVKTYSINDVNNDGILGNLGDIINYTFTVSNTGNVTLTAISIDDQNVTINGGPIASLAPGAVDNTTFTASHTITQQDIDKGFVKNTATATGYDPKDKPIRDVSDDGTPAQDTDGDGDPGNDPTVTPTPIDPAITLIKTAMPLHDNNGDGVMGSVGDVITYRFTVTNTGNVTLSNVMINDNLATVSGGPIASLAPGVVDNRTFTASHVITQADVDQGKVSNTATVSGEDPTGSTITDVSDHGSGSGDEPTVVDIAPPPPVTPTQTPKKVPFLSPIGLLVMTLLLGGLAGAAHRRQA